MATGPVVGLDIGTQQIKVVEVRPGKRGLVVSALGIAPTPVGVMQNNIITDPRMMGQTVKQLLRERVSPLAAWSEVSPGRARSSCASSKFRR